MHIGLTLFAALGGFLFGYDTSVINGAVFQMKDHFHFASDSWQYALIVAIAIVGAFLGALGNAFLATFFGRRISLITADVLFIVGSVLMGCAPNVEVVIVSRLIVGLGIGVSSSIIPVYLAEVTSAKNRGATIALNNLFITGGQFITAGFTALLVVFTDKNVGWRIATAVGALPAIVQLIGVIFLLPESPRWLLSKGRQEEAKRIAERYGVDLGEIDPDESISLDLRPLVRRAMRYRFFVGCMMMAIQQFAGINTIMYYSSVILEAAGFDDPKMPVIMSVPLAFVNAAFTIVSLFTIDRFGRRMLLLVSCGGYFIFMVIVTIVGFLLGKQIPYDIGGWLFVAILCVMLAFFAPGMGSVPWVLVGEYFPNHLRSSAASVATMCNWAANAVVSEVFPILLGAIGVGPVFAIIAGLVLLGWLFIFFFVVETKGLSLEQIDNAFRARAGLPPHALAAMEGHDYASDVDAEELDDVVRHVETREKKKAAADTTEDTTVAATGHQKEPVAEGSDKDDDDDDGGASSAYSPREGDEDAQFPSSSGEQYGTFSSTTAAAAQTAAQPSTEDPPKSVFPDTSNSQ